MAFMSKRSRRILFFFAFLVFVAGSYVAIIYAQGYKYSFEEKRFLHTGAIQLKVNDDAKVFINDKLDGGTSFFTNSHTINGLLPSSYVLRLEREGFTPWQKTAVVEEGVITDFPRIIILPTSEVEVPKLLDEIALILQSPAIITASPTPVPSATPKASPKPKPSGSPVASASTTPLPDQPFILQNKVLYINDNGTLKPYATNVTGYSISENQRKVLWWNDRDLWVGWLADQDYQPYQKAGDRELVTHFASIILKAGWFRGEDHIVIDANGYKIVELDQRGGQNIIRL